MPELKPASQPATIPQRTELKRALNLFDLTMIAVGATIGSGIFGTPYKIAQVVPAASWILFIWAVGAFFALAGALTNAEMGAMFPRAGGSYVFVTEAYGKLVGFLGGWSSFLVTGTGSIAGLVVLFSQYFNGLLARLVEHYPGLAPYVPMGVTTWALIGLLVITTINIFGVKMGSIFSNVFTILKLLGIGLLIVVGLGWGKQRGHVDFSFAWDAAKNNRHLLTALCVGFLGVHFSYGGLENSCNVAGEAKNPQRTVPWALLIGAVVVGVVYCLTNLAYLFLLPIPAIQVATGQAAFAAHPATPNVAMAAIETILGPVGAVIIALTVCVSVFGTTSTYTMTVPRIYFAMAENKVFFKKLEEVHPKWRTPVNAILLQSVWAVVLVLFWGTFDKIITFVVFSGAIMGALGISAIFVLRYRQPHTPRPYKTPLYPLTPAVYIAISLLLVANTVYAEPGPSLAGLGLLLAGIPVYFIWQRRVDFGKSEDQDTTR